MADAVVFLVLYVVICCTYHAVKKSILPYLRYYLEIKGISNSIRKKEQLKEGL